MKILTSIVLILLFPLSGSGQIVISGQILNYDGKSEIFINHAIEGVHPYFSESSKIYPQANGKFRFKFENPGIGVVQIHFLRANYAFVHDERSELSIIIDQDKLSSFRPDEFEMDERRKKALVRIDGEYREFNEFLNRQPRTAFISTRSVSGNSYSIPMAAIQDPDRFMNYYDSLRSRELVELQNIKSIDVENDSEISDEIQRFLKMEIETFYSGVVLNALFLKQIKQISALAKNSDTTLNMYNREWEKIGEQIFKELKESPQYANSTSYNELIQTVNYWLRSYRHYIHVNNMTTWDDIIVKGLLDPDFPADSLIGLNEKSKYAMQITNLRHYSNSQQFYSPVLVQAIDSMKSWHPGSKHLEMLESNFDKVSDYLEAQNSPYEKATVIEKNYTSLDGLFENFRGKTVLIDVWATWCHPCIGEFAYKNNLQDLISDDELVVLYISIDKQRWEDRWRENLNYNRLTGYHILADEILIRDLWEELGEPKGAIPRYALVNSDGEIVQRMAARPSMGDDLRNQILEILKN